MRLFFGVLLLLSSLIPFSENLHAQPYPYTATDLGQLQPNSINDRGQIVGQVIINNSSHARLCNQATTCASSLIKLDTADSLVFASDQ